MVPNQNNLGPAEQGGFLRVLGIIYLVKVIRQRRRARAESHRAESHRADAK